MTIDMVQPVPLHRCCHLMLLTTVLNFRLYGLTITLEIPKLKAKKLVSYIIFMFMISQPLALYGVVMFPTMHRLSPIEESRVRINKNYLQIAGIPASKVDKIRLTN